MLEAKIIEVLEKHEQSGEASFGPYSAVFEDTYEAVAKEIAALVKKEREEEE